MRQMSNVKDQDDIKVKYDFILSHAEQHVFGVFHIFFPFIGESGDSGTIQNSMVTTEADIHLIEII